MICFEEQYLNLLEKILRDGEVKSDRTGTGTFSIFGERLQFDVKENGFPILTSKFVPFRSVLSELIWFLEGSTDERRLAELLHGTRDKSKKTIWSPNAEGTSGSSYKPEFSGDLGHIYGFQWRKWPTYNVSKGINAVQHKDQTETHFDSKIKIGYIDQIQDVIHKLKTNPSDRRMIVSAWNPGELDKMALPPCHMMMQFYVRNGRYLDCQMYQRSVDSFLGLPFNISSYSLLMYIIAKEVDLTPGILTMSLGDTHIYRDHLSQVKEQLKRSIGVSPTLIVSKNMKLDDLKMEDFTLVNYIYAPAIKAKMSA